MTSPPGSSRRLVALAATAVVAAGAIAVVAAAFRPAPRGSGPAIPAPAVDEPSTPGRSEIAVFAGGCFWGVQGVFQHVRGVSSAVSGYTGGSEETAFYELVGRGNTGHAESVQVKFDPGQISYGRLLQIFFAVAHDPTELNRQGPDEGPQYRSTIFPLTPAQTRVAAAYITQLNESRVFGAPIATTIERGRTFYPAEDYHQDFLTLHPTTSYIVANDLPKIEALKKQFPEVYRAKPALVGVQ